MNKLWWNSTDHLWFVAADCIAVRHTMRAEGYGHKFTVHKTAKLKPYSSQVLYDHLLHYDWSRHSSKAFQMSFFTVLCIKYSPISLINNGKNSYLYQNIITITTLEFITVVYMFLSIFFNKLHNHYFWLPVALFI